jgi:DNA polymerase I-like protein with 3'-5' exonuclease and polymerase domains
MRLVFDLETNGFLDKLDRIHCIATKDIDTGKTELYHGKDVLHGMCELEAASLLIGHNILDFDLPALRKVFPFFKYSRGLFDTLIASRLIWPTDKLKSLDWKQIRSGRNIPKNMAGRHGLESWGYRLVKYKGDFKGPWETYTPVMGEYCIQDVEVNAALFNAIQKKGYSEDAFQLEQSVRQIIQRQEQYGFAFDVEKAQEFYADLAGRRAEIIRDVQKVIQPWYKRGEEFTPKGKNKKLGYSPGATFTRVKLLEFNPGSRDHIADRLTTLYGWKPKQFTPDGKAKVDESTMKPLTYEPMDLIREYMLVDKRISQLAEGDQAWLKKEAEGIIYGKVNTLGTVTRRMSHNNPNVAQVPKVGKPYGRECRDLFQARAGRILVGADASGLELRCLAHYLGAHDEGNYASEVVEGDVHLLAQAALGFETKDITKTFEYAYLYGAGNTKLGNIALSDGGLPRCDAKGRASVLGKKLRGEFQERIPGLAKLQEKVSESCKKGWILSLDRQPLHIRSPHSALNTLLQSAGAIIMKRALVILDDSLRSAIPDCYEFVANVHDEFQIECHPEVAQEIGERAVQAIVAAGEYYNFRCPLSAAYETGQTWADTH